MKSSQKVITFTRLLGIMLFLFIFPAVLNAAEWAPYTAYTVGTVVTYQGTSYTCRQAHTSLPGWEPPNVLALWLPGGTVSTSTPTLTPTKTSAATATATKTSAATATPTKTSAATATPTKTSAATATATKTSSTTVTPSATATKTPTAIATATATIPPATSTPTPTPGATPVFSIKPPPAGKVLAGYWECWDGSAVHPGMGWIPLSQVPAAYNVIDLAFPVILSDGTVKWENGMDVGVKVPTPAEITAAKAAGHNVLLSIGGATAAVDLSSSTVADRFIATIVPILKANNIDGIDIDIEAGLVVGASMTSLSTSQSNLIRIIDGVLAQMPAGFMLTMAPETAYVTGGQIAYGSIWGAYLPIIKRYLDNGRLNWLQMQYYNGSMYGAGGTAYSAGTVDGFVQQTLCMINGFTIAGGNGTLKIPAAKIAVGLPAQPGAGGGYMAPADVKTAYNQVSSIKGLMTWSINWDGSKGWTFANNKPF
jgi:chitinase